MEKITAFIGLWYPLEDGLRLSGTDNTESRRRFSPSLARIVCTAFNDTDAVYEYAAAGQYTVEI